MKKIFQKIEAVRQRINDLKPAGFAELMDELATVQQEISQAAQSFAKAETAGTDVQKAAVVDERLSRYTIIVDDSHEHAVVLSDGYVGPGNALHHYLIVRKNADGTRGPVLGEVLFQDGPIQEVGVNGVMNENLLGIVISRLEGFQAGPYKCEANQTALEAIEVAKLKLEERTAKRKAQNIEGTNTVGEESKTYAGDPAPAGGQLSGPVPQSED